MKTVQYFQNTVKRGNNDSFVLICSFYCSGQFIFVIELSLKKGREKRVFDGLAFYVGSPELTYSNQAGSQTT